jgi:hypothetical protein
MIRERTPVTFDEIDTIYKNLSEEERETIALAVAIANRVCIMDAEKLMRYCYVRSEQKKWQARVEAKRTQSKAPRRRTKNATH